jgi:hypothetical protein
LRHDFLPVFSATALEHLLHVKAKAKQKILASDAPSGDAADGELELELEVSEEEEEEQEQEQMGEPDEENEREGGLRLEETKNDSAAESDGESESGESVESSSKYRDESVSPSMYHSSDHHQAGLKRNAPQDIDEDVAEL